MNDLDDLLSSHEMIGTMVTRDGVRAILHRLDSALGLEGDVVEMGCCAGTTSLWITRLLIMRNSKKKFFVYDTFEGLPDPGTEDLGTPRPFKRGEAFGSRMALIKNFVAASLPLPEITQGEFTLVPLNKYPQKICFAFLDGDLYQSILDSLEIIVPRLVSQGVVMIHDLHFERTPGVKKACYEYFKRPLPDEGGSGVWINCQ